MDETGVIATSAPSAREPGPAPRWLRFGLGLLVLTGDTIGSVLSVADAAATAAQPSPRHAAWGMLVDLLGRSQRYGRALQRASRWRAATLARRLAPSIAQARRFARRLPGAAPSAGRWRAWQARSRAQLAGWTAVGQREEAASRTVALEALAALRERALARVSDSPDLKRVIREQSEGIAVTAVTELRNRSARADRLAERAVRRLFGRGKTEGPR